MVMGTEEDFEPDRDEVTREWRRLHNEELYDLYFSPNIIQVTKLRRIHMGGAWSTYGGRKMHTEFWWGDMREGDHLEDPGRGEDNIRMDLKYILV
jgi:hypothetical protein